MKTTLRIMLVLMLALGIASCSSSKKGGEGSDDTVVDGAGGDGLALELNGSSDDMTAGGLSTIYFNFNSARLSDIARQTLQANADYLKANQNIDIQVEGHADERGGIQYNLSLGEKRAKSVKDYLVALGVESGRITTISYGKEKPIAFGHDEQSWSKNRRANFTITAK